MMELSIVLGCTFFDISVQCRIVMNKGTFYITTTLLTYTSKHVLSLLDWVSHKGSAFLHTSRAYYSMAGVVDPVQQPDYAAPLLVQGHNIVELISYLHTRQLIAATGMTRGILVTHDRNAHISWSIATHVSARLTSTTNETGGK